MENVYLHPLVATHENFMSSYDLELEIGERFAFWGIVNTILVAVVVFGILLSANPLFLLLLLLVPISYLKIENQIRGKVTTEYLKRTNRQAIEYARKMDEMSDRYYRLRNQMDRVKSLSHVKVTKGSVIETGELYVYIDTNLDGSVPRVSFFVQFPEDSMDSLPPAMKREREEEFKRDLVKLIESKYLHKLDSN